MVVAVYSLPSSYGLNTYAVICADTTKGALEAFRGEDDVDVFGVIRPARGEHWVVMRGTLRCDDDSHWIDYHGTPLGVGHSIGTARNIASRQAMEFAREFAKNTGGRVKDLRRMNPSRLEQNE